MSIDFNCFCSTVLFIILSAVLLSVLIGVASCGCPKSSNVIHIGTASSAIMYNPPNSAPAADCTTDLIIFVGEYYYSIEQFPIKIS